MIQYDKDGVTLFYVDASGRKISHYFMEGEPYNALVMIRDAQLQAIRENTQTAANYDTALATVQVNVDAGHAMAAPVKPLQKVVSDTGETTFVPFDPPLKDLVPSNAGKPAPSGSIKVETPDKQAIMFNMIQAMFRKMFPDA